MSDFTPGPWIFEQAPSAIELAGLKGVPLEPHEGYFRTNSGGWIVTYRDTDEDGFDMGGPVCEVNFKGTAKRGSAYNAPDPIGQDNARLISAAPELFEALEGMLERYVGLVNSGDAGNWNPEEEDEVSAARAAISKAKGGKANG